MRCHGRQFTYPSPNKKKISFGGALSQTLTEISNKSWAFVWLEIAAMETVPDQ